MERDFFFPSIIRTTCRWSPCNIKSLSACSHREAASQAFLECPEIKRVLASSQSKKQENNRDPVTSYQHLISSSQRASRSSPQTAYTPDNTFQTVAKVIWCWQMSFVMTVTATIKLTTSIITIIFAPKVPIHKEHVFFSISTKKSTEWYYIQPTINTVYHISYCLRGCMLGFLFVSLSFFSVCSFLSVCGFFFFHVATLNESLPVFTGWGWGGVGWEGGWGCFRHKAGLLMSLPPPAPRSPPPPRDAGGCGASSALWAPSGLWPWGRPSAGLRTASSPGSTDWSGSSPAGSGWSAGPCTGLRSGSTGCWSGGKTAPALPRPPPARCWRPGWTEPPAAAWPARAWSSSPWPYTGTCQSQRAAETAGGGLVLSSESDHRNASAEAEKKQQLIKHLWSDALWMLSYYLYLFDLQNSCNC